MFRTTTAAVLLVAVLVTACGDDDTSPGTTTDPTTDTTTDTSPDTTDPATDPASPDAAAGPGPDAAADPGPDAASDIAAMCLAGVPDCNDTPSTREPAAGDETQAIDEAAILRDAEALIGATEDDALASSDQLVRLGRHGDENLPLTEDYAIGRMTVATEADETGTFRVVEVTVELTDGIVVLPVG